jgi:hypothetical protein
VKEEFLEKLGIGFRKLGHDRSKNVTIYLFADRRGNEKRIKAIEISVT